MMKRTAFLLFPLLFTVPSCNPCDTVDCDIADYITVEYLAQADSSNLYKTGHFHMDSLKVWVMERPDSLPVAIDQNYNAQFPQNVFDLSISSVDVAGFIFSPQPGLNDTLWVNLQLGPKSKCCGRRIEFTSGLFRSDTIRFTGYDKILKIYK